MSTFDLKLMPPPPLPARAAIIVIGVTGLVMLAAAIRFAVIGAWPVLPFMAIDLVLMFWAFRASARASRAYERLCIDERGLVVSKVAACGSASTCTLAPGFTRVELETVSAYETRLWLHDRSRSLSVGHFLTPDERQEVCAALQRALAGR